MNDNLEALLGYHQALDSQAVVQTFRARRERYRRLRRRLLVGFAMVAFVLTLALGHWLGWSMPGFDPLLAAFRLLETLPPFEWMGVAAATMALVWVLVPDNGWRAD